MLLFELGTCIWTEPLILYGGAFMITRRDLSELMSFHPEPYLTSSLYLEIDGSPQENYPIVLKDLIKQARQDLEKQQLTAELRKSIEDDFKRFSDFVSLQFNRHGVRSLIIFSCSARKWWRVFTLALPIRSRLDDPQLARRSNRSPAGARAAARAARRPDARPDRRAARPRAGPPGAARRDGDPAGGGRRRPAARSPSL